MQAVGGLRRSIQWWETRCHSTLVLNWIRHGVTLPWLHRPAPSASFANHPSAAKHAAFVNNAVEELGKAGCVRQWPHCPRVVSPLAVVPKRGGKLRLILDLRWINLCLVQSKFKCERLLDLVTMAQRGELFVTFNLLNGYWQVDMSSETHEFLGFTALLFHSFAIRPLYRPACFHLHYPGGGGPHPLIGHTSRTLPGRFLVLLGGCVYSKLQSAAGSCSC